MGSIRSINWTYTCVVANLGGMDSEKRTADTEREPSTHECECPEPCNCDHDNE